MDRIGYSGDGHVLSRVMPSARWGDRSARIGIHREEELSGKIRGDGRIAGKRNRVRNRASVGPRAPYLPRPRGCGLNRRRRDRVRRSRHPAERLRGGICRRIHHDRQSRRYRLNSDVRREA